MESPDQDGMVLHSFESLQIVRLSKSGTRESEQEQKPECEKEKTETRGRPPTFLTLTQIEFRIQQLNNRRLLLLEIQRCTKTEEQTSEETTKSDQELIEDNEELKIIQKELEELLLKKEELDKRSFNKYTNENQDKSHRDTPRGGIYTLPQLQQNQDDAAAAQNPSVQIFPAETLGRKPEFTTCSFCKEVVVTETHSTRGATMWLMCFMCSLMGCVAGCCLIPFFMKRFSNVHHTCPQCQSKIHTHKPL